MGSTSQETSATARRRKRVLFVCVENSIRSQMAEAFARIHGGDDVEAYSGLTSVRHCESKGHFCHA